MRCAVLQHQGLLPGNDCLWVQLLLYVLSDRHHPDLLKTKCLHPSGKCDLLQARSGEPWHLQFPVWPVHRHRPHPRKTIPMEYRAPRIHYKSDDASIRFRVMPRLFDHRVAIRCRYRRQRFRLTVADCHYHLSESSRCAHRH